MIENDYAGRGDYEGKSVNISTVCVPSTHVVHIELPLYLE